MKMVRRFRASFAEEFGQCPAQGIAFAGARMVPLAAEIAFRHRGRMGSCGRNHQSPALFRFGQAFAAAMNRAFNRASRAA